MTKLEDSLNGGYAGLYAEVVEYDTYKLRTLNYDVDLVLDLGANVGIFARFAQELWPSAKIISVEPHPENISVYKEHTKGTTLIEKAIGMGELYHNLGARNGSGEVYISKGLGYPDGGDERSSIATVMPSELIKKYWKPGIRSVVKMDIEGAENKVWEHPASMAALKKMDYLCFEVHYYAAHGGLIQEVSDKTMDALNSFRETHIVEIENVHFWAWKK